MFAKRIKWLFFGVMIVSCLVGTSAWARKVFLNGVRIDGITNQTFHKVKVHIDTNGDIHISGKQYKVQVSGQTPPARPVNPPTPPTQTDPPPQQPTLPVGERPSDGYIVVIQRSGAQASGYSLQLIINGQKARKVDINTEQDVVKVTRFLKKGHNEIIVEAYKENTTAAGTIKLMLGIGRLEGGRVFIQKPYKLEYTRSSSDDKNYRHIYSIYVR